MDVSEVKMPKYLKPGEIRSAGEPKVGDRVRVNDLSATLVTRSDGMHWPMPLGSGQKREGVVLAVDCVLPATPCPSTNKPRANDTIVACDNGECLFVRISQLERLS